MIYGYLLTSLITKAYAEDADLSNMANEALNQSSVKVLEQTELSDPCLEMLGLLIDDCIIQGHKYLKPEIRRFLYYLQKGDNLQKTLENPISEAPKVSQQFHNLSNSKTRRDSYKEELVIYYSILEASRRYTEVSEANDRLDKFSKSF